jgi:hypothetical protein
MLSIHHLPAASVLNTIFKASGDLETSQDHTDKTICKGITTQSYMPRQVIPCAWNETRIGSAKVRRRYLKFSKAFDFISTCSAKQGGFGFKYYNIQLELITTRVQ